MYRASWIARVHLEGYYDFYFDLLISFHSICPHIHTLIYCMVKYDYLSRVYLFAFDDETCDRPKRSAIQRGKPFFGTV